MRRFFLLALIGISLTSSCKKPTAECMVEGDDELYILLKQTDGSNFLDTHFPSYSAALTDNTGTFQMESGMTTHSGGTDRCWIIPNSWMKSDYEYIIEYPGFGNDTLQVTMVRDSSFCGGTYYYRRKITQVRYNDSTFTEGGIHTIIKN